MAKSNNTCTCCSCTRKRPLQFHVTIDPNLFPHEYEIAQIARKQRSFARLFREFLKEYAISVANQVKQEPPTNTHQ